MKQRLVPQRYKMRMGDVLSSEDIHPNTVLLKEPGLYCFLLRCKRPAAEPFMNWFVEAVLPQEMRKLAAIVKSRDASKAAYAVD